MNPSALTPPCGPLRIALADDHAIVRLGFRRLLELEPDLQVCAEYADAAQAEAGLLGAPRSDIDLLILDLSMPGRSGLDLLRLLRQERPALKVLIVSMHDSPALIAQCRHAGAHGFLAKSSPPETLVETVRRIGRDDAPEPATTPRRTTPAAPHQQLTARESEVLHLLLAGHPLDHIATQLGLSDKTVSNYQTLIRQKLGVGSAIELLHYGRRHGLVP